MSGIFYLYYSKVGEAGLYFPRWWAVGGGGPKVGYVMSPKLKLSGAPYAPYNSSKFWWMWGWLGETLK